MLTEFNKTFRWALCGSIAFELIVLVHTSALCRVIGLADYGHIVSYNSIIYLIIHIADFGATNSIPPFLHYFISSQKQFYQCLIRYTLLPHLPLILTIITISLVILQQTTLAATNGLMLALLAIIILLESVQAFLRQFLYALFKTKMVVSTEVTLLVIRVASLWFLYFFANTPLSTPVILWSHLVSTLLCLFFFVRAMMQLYKELPEAPSSLPNNFTWRLAKNRFFNYLLRLNRNLFTTNFITPLFAIQFGLKTAGVFFLASKLAKIIQAVVKICIGYSGNGLLARTKNADLRSKQQAFSQLFKKLMQLIAPTSIIFVLGGASVLVQRSIVPVVVQGMILSSLFLFLTFLEFFFQLYEQFYIVEELASRLFFVKVFEICALFSVTIMIKQDPVLFLSILIFTRLLTLCFIAFDAYNRWGIRPEILPPKQKSASF